MALIILSDDIVRRVVKAEDQEEYLLSQRLYDNLMRRGDLELWQFLLDMRREMYSRFIYVRCERTSATPIHRYLPFDTWRRENPTTKVEWLHPQYNIRFCVPYTNPEGVQFGDGEEMQFIHTDGEEMQFIHTN